MVREETYPSIGLASIGAVLGGATSAIGILAALAIPYHPHRTGGGRLVDFTVPEALPCIQPWNYLDCRAMLAEHLVWSPEQLTTLSVMACAPFLFGLGWFGYALYEGTMNPRRRYIEAGYPVRDHRSVRRALRKLAKHSPNGLDWFGGLKMPRKREKQGFLFMGQAGSGKTIALWPLLTAAQQRGDRLVIVDTKGDFTEHTPDDAIDGKPTRPIILGPEDARSSVWDVAADLDLELEAVEFATLIVPTSVEQKDTFWTDAARAILTVNVRRLMVMKPKAWSWQELYALCLRPVDEIRRDADRFYPEARTNLDKAVPKLTMSAMTELFNKLKSLKLVAEAWNEKAFADPKRRKVSLRRFLTEQREGRTLILQRSGRFETLADGWISAFVSMAGRTIGSRDMPVGDRSPLWFVIDEFAQLPRIPNIEKLWSVGRDRGVRAVLATQNQAQVSRTYGHEFVSDLEAQLKTKLIGSLGTGETARRIAEGLGEVIVRTRKPTAGPNGTTRWELDRQPYPCVHPADFETEFGEFERERCCYMLLLGVSGGPARARVPYIDMPEVRAKLIPADWTIVSDLGDDVTAEHVERDRAKMALMRTSPLSGGADDDEVVTHGAVLPGRLPDHVLARFGPESTGVGTAPCASHGSDGSPTPEHSPVDALLAGAVADLETLVDDRTREQANSREDERSQEAEA